MHYNYLIYNIRGGGKSKDKTSEFKYECLNVTVKGLKKDNFKDTKQVKKPYHNSKFSNSFKQSS